MLIRNSAQTITETDYWESEHGAAGALYLSINAGAFRLLVPPRVEGDVLPEIKHAVGAAISRGPWPAMRVDDAAEVLIDDGGPSPWCVHLSAHSVDRWPAAADVGRMDLRLSVWVRGEGGVPRCALELPARYRRSRSLPDLRPWDEK